MAGLREVHSRDHPRQAAPDDADLELLVLRELNLRALPRPGVGVACVAVAVVVATAVDFVVVVVRSPRTPPQLS